MHAAISALYTAVSTDSPPPMCMPVLQNVLWLSNVILFGCRWCSCDVKQIRSVGCTHLYNRGLVEAREVVLYDHVGKCEVTLCDHVSECEVVLCALTSSVCIRA
jgi:hypothetical protein